MLWRYKKNIDHKNKRLITIFLFLGMCCEQDSAYCCKNNGTIPYRCCNSDKPICCEEGKCCDTPECCKNDTIIDYELERLIREYKNRNIIKP